MKKEVRDKFEGVLSAMVKPPIRIDNDNSLGSSLGRMSINCDDVWITIKGKEAFKNEEEYYGILFHELVHFTRGTYCHSISHHPNPEIRREFEEVIAEIGTKWIAEWVGISKGYEDKLNQYISDRTQFVMKECNLTSDEVFEVANDRAKDSLRALFGKEVKVTNRTFKNDRADIGQRIMDNMTIFD